MFHQLIYDQKIIHYRDEGHGPVLILLHGFMESIEIWDYFIEQLSSQFRVIAIDLPGHGRSELFSENHPMASFLWQACNNREPDPSSARPRIRHKDRRGANPDRRRGSRSASPGSQ